MRRPLGPAHGSLLKPPAPLSRATPTLLGVVSSAARAGMLGHGLAELEAAARAAAFRTGTDGATSVCVAASSRLTRVVMVLALTRAIVVVPAAAAAVEAV